MAKRLVFNFKINISCSDYYGVYDKYIVSEEHIMTKAETCLVESFNYLIRHYLAIFNRKTKRYSKSLEMIYHSLILFSNRAMALAILGWQFHILGILYNISV